MDIRSGNHCRYLQCVPLALSDCEKFQRRFNPTNWCRAVGWLRNGYCVGWLRVSFIAVTVRSIQTGVILYALLTGGSRTEAPVQKTPRYGVYYSKKAKYTREKNFLSKISKLHRDISLFCPNCHFTFHWQGLIRT